MSVREVMSEVETLRALKNDAVLNLIEYYFVESESWVYVITDILYGGAVLDAILKMKDERYTEAEAKVVVQRVLVGIEYMHSNLVVHRDLKVRISHPPHSASLIAHTRTRRAHYLCPDCLSIHRDIQD